MSFAVDRGMDALCAWAAGIFDPLGFSKGNLEELKLKEIKNGAALPLVAPHRPSHYPAQLLWGVRMDKAHLTWPFDKQSCAQAASPCSASLASWCVPTPGH